MKNFQNNLYTAGQMAKLGRVTKATLFFYEKRGLLIPSYVAENGYRYYSIDDFFRLDMITILRFLGASIKEIKSFFDNLTTEKYVFVLKEKLKDIEAECQRLETLKAKMNSSIFLSEIALTTTPGIIGIEYQEEEYLLTEEILSNDGMITLETAFSRLMNNATQNGFSPDIHIGRIVHKEHILHKVYSPDYYFCVCPDTISNEKMHIKPSGSYLTMIHKGPYESLKSSYSIMDQYAQKHHLNIIGNAYEQPLIGWFNSTSKNDYATKILIKIEDN